MYIRSLGYQKVNPVIATSQIASQERHFYPSFLEVTCWFPSHARENGNFLADRKKNSTYFLRVVCRIDGLLSGIPFSPPPCLSVTRRGFSAMYPGEFDKNLSLHVPNCFIKIAFLSFKLYYLCNCNCPI